MMLPSAASLDADFPTLDAMEQTVMPVADRYDLAARFWGVTDVPPPLTSPQNWQLGDEQPFFVNATQSAEVQQIPAQLLAIGEHVLVWGETALDGSITDAEAFAARFDTEVYEAVTDFWGIEPVPGIDGDSRVHVLFTDQVRQGIIGYFSAVNTYPRAISASSNEHEMLTLHYAAVETMASDRSISTAVHEFQHLLRQQQDPNEFIWLDEGFSGLTQYELGFDTLEGWVRPFVINPQTQLNAWGTGDNRLAEYGAGFLFSLYFYERYGVEGLQALSQQEIDGLAGVDATLAPLDRRSADDFFADWVLANLLRDHWLFGYRDLPDMPTLAPRVVDAIPYRFETEARPYSTQYIELSPIEESISITLDLPETIPLIELPPPNGEWFWYSLRGDDSNPRLTRAFDLRDVESATLEYRLWYDLEENWDYGYISISADGGETWEVQQTPQMSDDDPNRRAYAPGYTGQSLFWREESLSLDAYAGKEILVRFEMVTDDAINQPGMALDDVRVEAIGYSADFETDDGGWLAEGWIHTDNQLPPRAWVQVMHINNGEPILTRWLAGGDSTIPVDPIPDTTQIFLTISPLAPLTTERIPYTLEIR